MGFLNYLNIYLISPIFIHFFPQQLSAVKLQNLEPLDWEILFPQVLPVMEEAFRPFTTNSLLPIFKNTLFQVKLLESKSSFNYQKMYQKSKYSANKNGSCDSYIIDLH